MLGLTQATSERVVEFEGGVSIRLDTAPAAGVRSVVLWVMHIRIYEVHCRSPFALEQALIHDAGQDFAVRMGGVFAFFFLAVSLPIAGATYDAPEEWHLRLLVSMIGGTAVVCCVPIPHLNT